MIYNTMLVISRGTYVFSLKVSLKVALICVMLYLAMHKSLPDTELFHVLWYCKCTNVYLNEGFIREQNSMCFDNFATRHFEKLLCWNFFTFIVSPYIFVHLVLSPTYALIYIITILSQAITLVALFTPTCFDPYGSSSGSTAGPC